MTYFDLFWILGTAASSALAITGLTAASATLAGVGGTLLNYTLIIFKHMVSMLD